MEFVLGSLITACVIAGSALVLKQSAPSFGNVGVKHSQSRTFVLMAPVLDYLPEDQSYKVKSQTHTYIEKSYIRVVIVEDNAYWIKDNALYAAEITEGFVNKETTHRVDTMSMDKLELEKTMYIVEKLREGLDEDSGTGE